MKKVSPKNVTIGLLLLTNIITAATLLGAQPSKPESGPKAAQALDTASHKKGILREANLNQSGELQACYETFLSRGPIVDEGVVEVHWMLDSSGKISSLELVRSELEDENFTGCVLDKIKRMSFHAPGRTTLVAHRFNFRRRTPANVDFK